MKSCASAKSQSMHVNVTTDVILYSGQGSGCRARFRVRAGFRLSRVQGERRALRAGFRVRTEFRVQPKPPIPLSAKHETLDNKYQTENPDREILRPKPQTPNLFRVWH